MPIAIGIKAMKYNKLIIFKFELYIIVNQIKRMSSDKMRLKLRLKRL